MSGIVEVRDLHKTYRSGSNRVEALRGIGLTVKEGEFFSILGPSGCGKTTLLRCIAGLERIESGEIDIDGAATDDARRRLFVPPHRRPVGMVFQSYAVWPHMTVGENVMFVLTNGKSKRLKRSATGTEAVRVRETLALVGLEAYASRPAPQLSGGQQQRLALARSIVRKPKVLLLDEPLSNLDAELREQMREELRILQRSLGTTTIYVTHDQSEALALSDRLAVLEGGEVREMGAPQALYHNPQSDFVARFLGKMNVIRGHWQSIAPPMLAVGAWSLGCREPGPQLHVGGEGAIGISPEHVDLVKTDEHTPIGQQNALMAKVSSRAFLGQEWAYRLRIKVREAGPDMDIRAVARREFEVESNVYVVIPPERCVALDVKNMAQGDEAAKREETGVGYAQV